MQNGALISIHQQQKLIPIIALFCALYVCAVCAPRATAAYFVNVTPSASATAQYSVQNINTGPFTNAGPASSQAINSGVSFGSLSTLYADATNSLTTTDTSLSASVIANTGWGSTYSFPPNAYTFSASSSLSVSFQVTTSGLYSVLADLTSQASSYGVRSSSAILTITDLTNPSTQLSWAQDQPMPLQLLATDTYQLTLNASTNMIHDPVASPTFQSASLSVTAVPEPCSLALIGCTLFTFTGRRRNCMKLKHC